MSLPCTGGSPLLNFSKAGVREHHQAKFLNLLSSLGGYLDGIKRLDPKALITFELPHQNQYWRLDLVRSFRERWKLLHHGVAAGCRTGLCTSQGVPIGKRYRIVSENQEVAQCVHQRFSECHCSCEHAAFYKKIRNVSGSNSISCQGKLGLKQGFHGRLSFPNRKSHRQRAIQAQLG